MHLDHVAITTTDPRRSIAWYTDVLGLERRDDSTEPAFLFAGDSSVAIFTAANPDAKHHAGWDTLAVQHFAFALDRPAWEAKRDDLARRNIPARFADHTICHSLYLTDPDGHTVELTTYDV